jgi:hypothetical protein
MRVELVSVQRTRSVLALEMNNHVTVEAVRVSSDRANIDSHHQARRLVR